MAENKHGKRSKTTHKKRIKKEKNNMQTSKENKKELKKAKKIKFKDKHPKIALTIKILIILFLLIGVVGAGIFIGVIYGAFGDEFEITVEELVEPASNSIIYDSEGNVLAELNGDENRKNITLDEMSSYLANAYVAIEDERFEKHNGVDFLRTGKAILTFVTNGGSSSFGGSTITQQLVKNITKEDDDEGVEGITRKVKEWAKAYQIERMISKNQILELYLNTIFVGGQNYGVETGAHYYFNKSAHDLTLVECAFLAGINSAPNAYNPYGTKPYGTDEAKTKKINNKVKVVINKMLEVGYISQEERDTAIKEVNEQGMKFTKGERTTNYSYHTDALINQLVEDLMEEKQLSKAAAQSYLQTKGLKIYSTESASIQAKAQEAMNNGKRLNSKTNVDENGNAIQSQAGIVIIDHKTGYVLGCVGGLGEKTAGGFNRATQAKRRPGSTIKPLASIAVGLEEKVITAATLYNDDTTDFYVKGWNPHNYGGINYGIVSIRQAIETSQNIPFIKVVKEITPEKSIDYLEKMGIKKLSREQDLLAAISLGGLTNGVTPLEMAVAYGTIANDGVYIEPTFYTKVLDSDGNVVIEAKQETRRVISETTAYITKNLLTQPVLGPRGTARKCAIKNMDVAAKTGTSNEDIDRWLCGFTNYYTAAVWYGFDQEEPIYGSGSPATPIWAEAMTKIHEGLEGSRFKVPNNIITATICRDSGKLASDTCTNTYAEIFEKGTIPEGCQGHTGHLICKDTNLLANEYCKNTETIYKTYLLDKEKLGLWTTNSNNEENIIPETYCEVHQKPVEPVIPEEPEIPEKTEKPEETDKPTVSPEENKPTEKPEDGDNKPTVPPNEEDKPTVSPEDGKKPIENKPSEEEKKEDNTENDGAIGGEGDEIPPLVDDSKETETE